MARDFTIEACYSTGPVLKGVLQSARDRLNAQIEHDIGEITGVRMNGSNKATVEAQFTCQHSSSKKGAKLAKQQFRAALELFRVSCLKVLPTDWSLESLTIAPIDGRPLSIPGVAYGQVTYSQFGLESCDRTNHKVKRLLKPVGKIPIMQAPVDPSLPCIRLRFLSSEVRSDVALQDVAERVVKVDGVADVIVARDSNDATLTVYFASAYFIAFSSLLVDDVLFDLLDELANGCQLLTTRVFREHLVLKPFDDRMGTLSDGAFLQSRMRALWHRVMAAVIKDGDYSHVE